MYVPKSYENGGKMNPAVVAKWFKSSTLFKHSCRAQDPGSNPAWGMYVYTVEFI